MLIYIYIVTIRAYKRNTIYIYIYIYIEIPSYTYVILSYSCYYPIAGIHTQPTLRHKFHVTVWKKKKGFVGARWIIHRPS